ncbi:YgfZ/GcvT domain-containing protein [Legionella dresdenensis]|uniref:YgfZ/GcvT domain-containing protein n=1 Tax=Legionella dresdenensis TaxID=450200 RepID=A0ABV8CGE4_9GAMM
MYKYTINGRDYSAILPIEEELAVDAGKNYLFDLSYLTIIALEGANAAAFLQGQLTCDVTKVGIDTIRQGLFCNLKGRILASTDVISWQGYKLVIPADLAADTHKSLATAAMLSRVSMSQCGDYAIWGLYCPDKNNISLPELQLPEPYCLHDNGRMCCYSIADDFYIMAVKKEHSVDLTTNTDTEVRGSLAWHMLQLQRPRIEIYPSTRGLFLPHRLDLHKHNYISFNKGCYKGQEIIARTHYRAKLKHDLKTFEIVSSEPVNAGMKLFAPDSADVEVGEIVDICPVGNNRYLMAVSILVEHPAEARLENSAELIKLMQVGL